MIELGSSIISSTIATCVLYPAERIRIEMQLNTVKNLPNQNAQKQFIKNVDHEQKQLLSEQETKSFTMDSGQLQQNQQTHQNQRSQEKVQKDTINILTESQQRKKKSKEMSIASTVRQVYQKHGWTGFYSGLESLVIGNGLSYGVYFVLYEKCKTYLGFEPGSVIDTIKCSGLAGIGSSIATNPFWILQTRQAQSKGSILQKGKHLIESQGFTALWKGLSSSLILVSNPIIQFVIYEQLKKVLKLDKDSRLYDLVIFLIGAVSKMISTLCTYPLTIIRTKQHISSDKKKWNLIIKQIIKAQGMKGLFKGIQPKLIQTVLNSALLLMLFERIRKMMMNHFLSKA